MACTFPEAFETLVFAVVDEDIEWQARMALGDAKDFLRANWFVDFFATMQGLSAAYIDDFWRSAALIT